MNLALPFFDQPIASPVLIGRTQELETLERALASAQHGTGQCLLIAGDAGVGKSRLLSEIRSRASNEDLVILQGYCFEHDSAFPYAPLVDALRAFLAQRSSAEIRAILGPLAAEIVKLVPELALSLTDLQPTPALDPEAEKRRLFEALIQFYIRLAGQHTLLIILEDLHWSDKLSLDFLHIFARRLAAHPILLLGSYRQEEAPLPLTHLLAQLDRDRLAHEIRLAALGRQEVETMLGAIFDLSDAVKAEFIDLLYPLTEGNPFLIEEVLKALIAAGGIFYNAGRWQRRPIEQLHIPRSVQDAVQQRMHLLGALEQQVLTLAAVIGRRFGFTLLQESTGMNEQELVQVIKQLIAAQLVVEESADLFSFRHALMREAAYATLLRRERKVLHRRVAETLERIYAGSLDQHTADLAYHYHAAEAWPQALQFAQRAGEKAHTLYAPHAAIEHFTNALEAARRLAVAPPLEILRMRGRAYDTAGYFEAARADYEQVLSAAQQAGDEAAEWQALIALGFLWASRDYRKTGDYFRRALDLARRLGQPATIAHSLNRLGNWYANIEQPGEGLRYHQEAQELFQALNDQRGLVETLDLLGMTYQLNSDLLRSHDAYRRAIDLWRRLDDRWGLVSSLASLPLCAPTYLKNLDIPAIGLSQALEAGTEALNTARDIGWRAGEAYALINLAISLGPLGEYRQALEAAQTSLASAEDIEHGQWIAGAHAVLGALYLDVLAFDAARSHLERALSLAAAVGSQIWSAATAGLLATACAAQGEYGRAEALVRDTLQNDTAVQTQGQRTCWHARAQVAMARGHAEIALEIANRMVAATPHLTPETVIPRLWRLRAEALAALGRSDEAETVLQAARQTALAQQDRSQLWRIHAALGRLYQAQSRRADAQQQCSAALEVIQRLAATLPQADLQHNFIERATAMLPRNSIPAAQAKQKMAGGLTRRECEVAVLIAQGMANREIAGELVVGVRTVEAHITRILSKLDFSSRAQIAAWAVESGLTRPARQDPD